MGIVLFLTAVYRANCRFILSGRFFFVFAPSSKRIVCPLQIYIVEYYCSLSTVFLFTLLYCTHVPASNFSGLSYVIFFCSPTRDPCFAFRAAVFRAGDAVRGQLLVLQQLQGAETGTALLPGLRQYIRFQIVLASKCGEVGTVGDQFEIYAIVFTSSIQGGKVKLL